MARLFLRGYLVNDTIYPEYEVSAQNLIHAFIGDDTGAPLSATRFYLETDDGYRVEIYIPASGDTGAPRATGFEATVYPIDSDPELMDSVRRNCLEPPEFPNRIR